MDNSLTGRLSAPSQPLVGKLSTQPTYTPYTGDYKVTPKPSGQTLHTASKILYEDIKIAAVPYHETSNDSNGLTVHIAEEV